MMKKKIKFWSTRLIGLMLAVAATACGGERDRVALRPGIECGWEPGMRACNLQARDQWDRDHQVEDWLGRTVVVQVSGIWCAACTHAAIESAEYRLMWEDQVSYVILLVDGAIPGEAPAGDEVQAWASEIGVPGLVLGGNPEMVGPTPRMVLEGYPTLFVIDRWGTVRSKQWGTDGLVDSVNQVVYGKPKPPAEEPPPSDDPPDCKHPEEQE